MRLVIFPIPNCVFLLLYEPVSAKSQVVGEPPLQPSSWRIQFLCFFLTPLLLYWMTILLKWSSFLYFLLSGKNPILFYSKIHWIGLCAFYLNTDHKVLILKVENSTVKSASLRLLLHPHLSSFRHLKKSIFCCFLSLLFCIIYWYFVVVKVKALHTRLNNYV